MQESLFVTSGRPRGYMPEAIRAEPPNRPQSHSCCKSFHAGAQEVAAAFDIFHGKVSSLRAASFGIFMRHGFCSSIAHQSSQNRLWWPRVWQDQYRWQGCIYGAANGCSCSVRLELSATVCMLSTFEEHLLDSMKGTDSVTYPPSNTINWTLGDALNWQCRLYGCCLHHNF